MLTSKAPKDCTEFLQKLKRLERQYGMRLPGISDRLSERFVKPLSLDRILALVKPVIRDARAGKTSDAFAQFKDECERYLTTTLGSALEPQAWLQSVEEEVQQVETDEILSPGASEEPSAAARVPIDLEELQQQLAIWEKPLEQT